MLVHYHKKESQTTSAKKSLGQNFLTDKNKIKNIVAALDLKDNDTVIEIGPGHGELTNELITFNKELRMIAIEKDEKLAGTLREDAKISENNIEIITGDVLKVLPLLVKSHKLQVIGYKLVGNIPYYITGFLLRIISELEIKPEVTVFTVQKEVAERICAKPPKMNLLAASIQIWARPEIVGIIPKKYFNPQPKVDSAIIKLTTNNHKPTTKEVENYYKFIKILFKQPRKTILNNLNGKKTGSKTLAEKISALGVDPASRPQDLPLEKIAELSNYGL
ncbi:MAG: 16S rRNA (adenine(1518)-N(6)/adenine(1519)-N(6))-dimethyltransferase RsmA [Minisyncoccia bacterium]